jgi:TonB-dependent starch-binding outer membrane protein SusC
MILLPLSVLAQSTLTGTVVDSKTKQPIAGVNVLLQGATSGASTDFDGKFTVKNIRLGDKINFTFVGYKKSTITFSDQKNLIVSLVEDSNELKEVVVQVGYGSVKKKDATGAVTIISSKDFNKGSITSADQLLVGKAPGVRITSSGGAPDSAPNIRIRGGSSLNASNNPLIVIDGVPIDNVNPAGISNPLSLVNPNDIESFSILKDASATAIYGSRASNGVIIITTKKGASGKPQFNYSAITSIGTVAEDKRINVMDGPTYSAFVAKNFPLQTYLLGIDDPNTILTNDPKEDNPTTSKIEGRILSNTNWQKAIFRTSITYEHNFSVRANLFKKLPIRFSLGYLNSEGVIRTNDYKRFSGSLKLTPTLLHDNLKVDLNIKVLRAEKNAIDGDGALGNSLSMDPTKPIYDLNPNNIFGGYYQENSPTGINGSKNPLALLEQRKRPENVNKLIGNIQLEYKLPFFPALKAVINAGIDASKSNIEEIFLNNAIATYGLDQSPQLPPPAPEKIGYTFNPGTNYVENQTITNKLLDAYLVYEKPLKGFISKFNFTAGHSFQSFLIIGNKEIYANNTVTAIRELRPDVASNPTNRYKSPYAIESYFARSNIDLKNKYLFTFTLRADGSSLFQPTKRWGYFPAGGFAWKIKEESFLKESNSIKDIKLRIGYGLTGQNDIIDAGGYFPSSPLFLTAGNSSQYFPGVQSYSALPFNFGLTWEKTATFNAGLDFELLNKSVLSGSIDIYERKTTDLLAKVPAAPGTSLTNTVVANVGSLENKGVELNLNIKAIQTDNFNLSFNGNISYNKGKVTDLNNVTEIQDEKNGLPGIGSKFIYNIVGEEPYSGKVFEQIYNANGQPLQGSYVDRNNDGIITDADKYIIALRPNTTFGLGTTINYKNLDLTATFRGQKGGKTYNVKNYLGQAISAGYNSVGNSLNNVLNADLPFATQINIPFSDYFLEDASFLRCENITLGYKFNNTAKGTSLRMYFAGNNLFIITKYSGQDPENFNAIDNNFYPRPRVLSLGVNIDF